MTKYDIQLTEFFKDYQSPTAYPTKYYSGSLVDFSIYIWFVILFIAILFIVMLND